MGWDIVTNTFTRTDEAWAHIVAVSVIGLLHNFHVVDS